MHTLEKRLGTLEKRVRTLEKRLNDLEKRLNALEQRPNALENPSGELRTPRVFPSRWLSVTVDVLLQDSGRRGGGESSALAETQFRTWPQES